MAYGGFIIGRRRGKREESHPLSKHRIQPYCGERAGRRGTGRPNLSREPKFSGANGDRENNIFPCLTDHEQDWQPYPVGTYSVESADHSRCFMAGFAFSAIRREK